MRDPELKPLTSAPPPLSAAATIIVWLGVSCYFFPTINDKSDVELEALFTHRVFPEYLSVQALVVLRICFALVCLAGFLMAFMTPPMIVKVPYRPQSRLPRIKFLLGGWKKQYPFTSWSWNLLGISFTLSASIAYMLDNNMPVPNWLLKVAWICWEIAAPMTLLIGAVVKYALWPAQIKQSGDGDVFRAPRALLQHNGNVIMAVTEAALMGGLPVQFSHLSLSVIYGCAYVLFSWAIMNHWHGKGPAALYFFMDTTLGTEHTIALYALLFVLMVFHSLFCGIDSLLLLAGHNLAVHAVFAVGICALVCRFRD